MEVATTNNHHHHHHHHHHHNQSHLHVQAQHLMPATTTTTTTTMATAKPRSPFQREVREWQRIDPDTGALLTGRLEADRWQGGVGPLNSSYGKISDSQNISQPNGTQHTQRKQLEVLQARTANGGAMQVIRAQTVQTTSSRSTTKTTTQQHHHQQQQQHITHNGSSSNSLFHNHQQQQQHQQSNSSINNNNNTNSHYHKSMPSSNFIAETNTRWLQLPTPALQSNVNISEISDSDAEAVDIDDEARFDEDFDVDVEIGVDADAEHQRLINGASTMLGSGSHCRRSSLLNRHSFNGNSSSSGSGSSSQQRNYNKNNKHSNYYNSNINTCITGGISNAGNALLLDTAPSLKLSNLMKSSSSISSTNSGSNSSIAATTMNNNSYNSASKVSLHAIVGNNNNDTRLSTTASLPASTKTTAAAAMSTLWQRQSRHFEQPTLYGNSSNSLAKSRVGVNNCVIGSSGGGGGGIGVGAGAGAGAGAGDAADDLRQRSNICDSDNYNDDDGDGDDDELTPTQLNRQRRRDLESFRHYNKHAIASNGDNDADDDDDLRFSTSRYQRRQQNPSFGASLQRSRSISTDDLSTEWDAHGEASEEPGEWRRVSKLRRSFQSNSTTNEAYNTAIATTTRRPIPDLPSNTVSVSRIRAELEAGRRLNTAMRNNHVDLAALDNILNATSSTHSKAAQTKRNTFLTAESLKEIRGKLKKLSDESLYKEDFLAYQQLPAAEEQIEVPHVKALPERVGTRPKSAFQAVSRKQPPTFSPVNSYTQQSSLPTGSVAAKHTTNSLESRSQKYKDTSSSEWHLRRKSYGFEKMSPPDDKSMFRMDASTDSGLGRSGELGNWSPTDSTPAAARATVIHFGESAQLVPHTNAVRKRYRALNSPGDSSSSALDAEDMLKRHSIAVDESQYVRDNLRKTSQVHLNGFYDADVVKSLQTETSTTSTLFQRTQQKRVEFCKTEVHFAAESGRVNIVETDGKPPPTNNFRRRRRTSSGPLQSLVKAATTVSSSSSTEMMPITHFGDDHRRKTIASTVVAYKASLVDAQDMLEPTNVTVSIPKLSDAYALMESSRNSYASTSGVDTTDNETDEISAIRGILKNKPIKPKPYHLGENIDSADALWGVQLKPIGGTSLATSGESAVPCDSSISATALSKSVAERVRIVEKRQDLNDSLHTNGYSTKIKLSLDDAPKAWEEDLQQPQRRPSAQELLLQDLREHQRILDEGLKSTSLIIKTMRSANEFDEAMRRLSIASAEAAVIPPIVVPTPMLRSNSYQETTRRFSTTSLDSSEQELIQSTTYTNESTITRRYSTDSQNYGVPPIPVAAPRLKLLGNTEIPVSQQLSQLRRMYEVAAARQSTDDDDDDSADEEVKRYFCTQNDTSDSGGGTQESSSLEDERGVEYSSSWSRLKAKRTIWKIEAEDLRQQKLLPRAELPKSNVMSIELRSPQERQNSTLKRTQTPPIAKPRTLASIKQTEHPPVLVATSVQQTLQPSGNLPRNSLKIIKEARGARKLRDHELSYFGVQVGRNENVNHDLKSMHFGTPKRSLPQRSKLIEHEEHANTKLNELSKNAEKQTTKWQLLNDKPDLLRHSPIAVEPQVITRTAEIKPMERKSLRHSRKPQSPIDKQREIDEEDDENEEHFYENISNEITPVFKVKSPLMNSYDRKMDLKRDAQILSEMTRNADQTMKALSDEAAIKDQRRRSLQRRNSKPLETIDEKAIAEKITDTCIAVKVSRSTLASEAKRSSRHSTPSPTTVASRARTSSQSSVESCPRARSRSLSSEREDDNIKARATVRTSATTRHSASTKHAKANDSRSSSRESQRSAYSSGEEERCRREERLRNATKTRRSTSASAGKEKHERREKTTTEKHNSERPQRGSTTHSSQRERVECSKPQHHQQHQEHRSSSSRRHRDGETSRSAVPSSHAIERKERVSTHHDGSAKRLVRSAHVHEHDGAALRSSSHRLERGEKGEKEKLSRTRGHSSRSTTQHSSERHHSASQSAASPIKTREHKKSTATNGSVNETTKQRREHDKNTIHSKNAPILNGHRVERGEQQLKPQQHQHHTHPVKTSAIRTKSRERSRKDRK